MRRADRRPSLLPSLDGRVRRWAHVRIPLLSGRSDADAPLTEGWLQPQARVATLGWVIDGPDTRPTHAARHSRCQSSDYGAHNRTDEYVTRVVHPGIHAGKRHDEGCPPQRLPQPREDVPNGSCEGGSRSGVT
jgi:hypothetical protein